MLANLVCSLIKHKRITTTLAKAKAARPVAEKMITLGKEGTLHARRLAASRLRARGRSLELSKEQRKKWRQEEDVVRILFDDLAPVFKERRGGYTRIIHLGGVEGRYAGQRRGDSAKRAILEWIELPAGASETAAVETAPAEAEESTEATKS
jgi:large subunit ribosomal protein L17